MEKSSTLENGQTLREYDIYAINKDIEIMPGIVYPPGRIMGASRARPSAARKATGSASISSNGSAHPHSMHFHGIHPAEMDGVPGTPGMINPGEILHL